MIEFGVILGYGLVALSYIGAYIAGRVDGMRSQREAQE